VLVQTTESHTKRIVGEAGETDQTAEEDALHGEVQNETERGRNYPSSKRRAGAGCVQSLVVSPRGFAQTGAAPCRPAGHQHHGEPLGKRQRAPQPYLVRRLPEWKEEIVAQDRMTSKWRERQ